MIQLPPQSLAAASDATLAQIAEYLRANPGTALLVVGHSANVGD
jgi:outer membrane protein OmpA-like peptidoglycan-associated protein